MKPVRTSLRLILYAFLIISSTPAWSQFYEPRVLYEGHESIISPVILDFNHDGLDDVVMTRPIVRAGVNVGTGLYVYQSYLDAGELAYTSSVIPASKTGLLWKIDIDRDDDFDFISQDVPNIWEITSAVIDNKDGVFSIASSIPDILKDSLLKIRAVIDLDHDGYDEIVYTKDSLGLWSASFMPGGEVVTHQLITDFQDHEFLDAGDFNKDGYEDLVINDEGKEELLVWISEGGLSYHSIVADTQFSFLSKYIGLSDYSSTGQLEIMVSHYDEHEIRLIRPDLSGGNPSYNVSLSNTPTLSSFLGADFNADGFKDLVLTSIKSYYYLNDGFGHLTLMPNDLRINWNGIIVSAAYDLPAHKTTVYMKYAGLQKYTYDNGHYDLTQVPIPDLYITNTTQTEVKDINTDGFQDIVFCGATDFGGIGYIEGKEGKTFGDMHPILIDEIDVNHFSLEDFNGDGFPDLLYPNRSKGIVKIKYGNESGKFCCTQEIFHGSDAVPGLRIGDFEGDHFSDILVSELASGEIFLIRNHGGVFESPEVAFEGEAGMWDVLDIDLDGDDDVYISKSVNNQNVSEALFNDGHGHFTEADLGMLWYRDHKFHDFDFDGIQEYLAIGNETIIYKFDGAHYVEWLTIPANQSTTQFYAIVDYNQDGYDDILFAKYNQPVQLSRNDHNQAFIDDGLFSDKFGFEIPNSSSLTEAFSGNDLDGDGDIDFFYGYRNDYYWISQIKGKQSINGTAYWDLNKNNQQDTTESGIRDMKVSMTNANGFTASTFTQEDGNFNMQIDTGTYEVYLTSSSSCWKTDHENPGSVIVAESEIKNIEVPFYIDGEEHKVFASLTHGVARCNQEVVFNFKLTNDGCKVLNGLAYIILDPIIDSFIPLLTIPYEVEGRKISFRADSLLPGESRNYKINVHMPGFDFLGSALTQRITYLYELADGTLKDLEYGKKFTNAIRCSYDPNDKIASPDRSTEFGDAYVEGEDLFYTIRFQNTGNDTAFMIRLEDTISALLDLNTLRALDASHPYRIVLNDDRRLLSVYFDNILLPDSSTNRTASEGYFSYSIRPYDSLPDYTHIYNDAGIYFDLNPPVLTNTTELTYVSDLSILGTETHETNISPAFIYPNPSTGIVHIESTMDPETIAVYNLYGRRVNFNYSHNILNLAELPEGMYCIVMTSGETSFLGKVVIQR